MKITEKQLRTIIINEIKLLTEAEAANVGKDVEGTSASKLASQKLASNPALLKSLDPINDVKGLTDFIQDIIRVVSKKGIDQGEATKAITQVLTTIKKAK